MVDPTTVNTSLAIPIRGTDVGVWDIPVNNNFTAIDSMIGGVTTVALSSVSVTLASSQAQSSIIRITGTTTVNSITINLPSIYKGFTIDNQLLNSPSSFFITLTSTSGTYTIGVAPGVFDYFYDGSAIGYRNMGRIGEYWDYAGTVVPGWASNGTKPPYLLCNGTAFSSATYPLLTHLLGGTTLPDARGRVRAMLNQGTARLNTVIVDAVGFGGGDQLPQSHSHTGSGTTTTDSVDHSHIYQLPAVAIFNGGLNSGSDRGLTNTPTATGGISVAHTHSYSFTTTTFGAGNSQNVQPTYMGGITMIRAA